ncbi:MAG: hypothetical protein ACR2MM_10220 [Flavobacteriaceae bacterium]
MGVIEKYEKPFEYAGVLMNLFLAIQFIMLWYSPGMEQAEKIYTSVWLIMFEFFMVHSSVVLAVLPKKISFIFLFAFYGIFAWLFNRMVPGNLILYIYLILVLNRMRYAFYDVEVTIKKRTIWSSSIAFVTYIVLGLIIGFGNEYVSQFGLTEEYLSTSGYNQMITKGGFFIDRPHLGLCLGAIYYIFLSVETVILTNYWRINKVRLTDIK